MRACVDLVVKCLLLNNGIWQSSGYMEAKREWVRLATRLTDRSEGGPKVDTGCTLNIAAKSKNEELKLDDEAGT